MVVKPGELSKPAHQARIESSVADTLSKLRDTELLCCDIPQSVEFSTVKRVLRYLEQAEDLLVDVYRTVAE